MQGKPKYLGLMVMFCIAPSANEGGGEDIVDNVLGTLSNGSSKMIMEEIRRRRRAAAAASGGKKKRGKQGQLSENVLLHFC